MTEKQRSREKFLAKQAERKVQRNAEGRTARGQRALERAVKLEYEYDRDFEFETPGGSDA